MNTRQILCFLQLAETKSFSAVAEKMFLSISTVSYQLRHFKEELGFPLFFRDQHSVTLTPAGAAYAEELRKSMICTRTPLSGQLKFIVKARH